MRLILSSLAFFLVVPQALADGPSVIAKGGYESIDAEHGNTTMEHSGFQLGVLGQYSFTEIAAVDLTLGGGVKYSRLVGEKSAPGGDIEATISQPMAALEAGFGGHVIPELVYLQGTVGYDFGFAGTDTVKQGGESNEIELEKYRQWAGNLRGFYRVAPGFDVGLQLAGTSGELRGEGSNEDTQTSGISAGLLLRASL